MPKALLQVIKHDVKMRVFKAFFEKRLEALVEIVAFFKGLWLQRELQEGMMMLAQFIPIKPKQHIVDARVRHQFVGQGLCRFDNGLLGIDMTDSRLGCRGWR